MEKIAEIQKITELLLEKLMIKTTFAITEKDQLYLIQIEEILVTIGNDRKNE